MNKSDIIKILETIEGQLDDAYNTLPEYDANSEGKSYIDGARCDLYYLKEETMIKLMLMDLQHILSIRE